MDVKAYLASAVGKEGSVIMKSEKSPGVFPTRLSSRVTTVPIVADVKAGAPRKTPLAALGLCAMLSVSVAACANSGSNVATSSTSASATKQAAAGPKPDAVETAPFAGSWESCAGTEGPEQCSRYLLLQRGKRICGTWSYFASGDGYEGKIIAEATSPLEARRTRICGRPGSETRMDCETGWEAIDRPLRLCGGKLGDLDGKKGSCFADFRRVESAGPSLKVLVEQPWIQACLSRNEEGDGT